MTGGIISPLAYDPPPPTHTHTHTHQSMPTHQHLITPAGRGQVVRTTSFRQNPCGPQTEAGKLTLARRRLFLEEIQLLHEGLRALR